MTWSERSHSVQLTAAAITVAVVTLALRQWPGASNVAIVSTTYLLVVLLIASTSRRRVAIAASVGAMLCLNYFFLPPIGTLTIADPLNWMALFAFLTVSLAASHLSAVARARTEEAVGRRNELARLFDLSRDVLMMSDSRDSLTVLARSIARRFDLDFIAIAVPQDDDWDIYDAGSTTIPIDTRELSSALAAAQSSLEFDAHSRTYAGHRTISVNGHVVRLVPLRVGTTPIGVLAAIGRPVEAGTLDTLAGVVAIAIERAQFFEERKAGELTKQSEQLKTALLASLGHDLRTPLTAIRIAASNIKSGLPPEVLTEQSDLIVTEIERLTRLFQNLLDMARIDAGAVAAESRATHPSEIVAAARDQAEHSVRGHRLDVRIDPDVPVRVDPRLTSTALAHLLENAAQYSPPGSTIHVMARGGADELTIAVRDEGAGIATSDLPHLFERFYRGTAARTRASGTGMGLWIVRGLLAVEHGRVWAENRPEGGAQFTIAVPNVPQAPTAN